MLQEFYKTNYSFEFTYSFISDSCISGLVKIDKKFIKKKLNDNKNLEITEYDDEVLKNNYSLSSREIIVYLVLFAY